MTRSKVLQITPFFLFKDYAHCWNPRFDPLGGMQLLTHAVITGLADKGVQQEVVTMGLPGVPRDVTVHPRVLVHSRRLPVLPIRSGLEGYFGLVLAWGLGSLLWIMRNRRRLKAEVAIVHVHMDGSGSAPALGFLASKLLKAKLVAEVHSCRTLTQVPTTWFETLVDPAAKWTEMKTLSEADRVMTLTDKLKNQLVERLPNRKGEIDRLAFLTSVEFAERNTPERRKDLINRFRLPTDRPIVMYLGRIAAEKGVDCFVEAAGILAERRAYHFLICGDGPERESIDALVKRYGLGDRCTVTGFLAPELVPPAIGLSAVGVVPSKYEELGLIILEFMLMGRPVIAHDVGGVSELIKHQETGILVPPYQPEALAAAVESVVENPALGERLAANAATIPDRYSLAAAVDRLLKAYGELGLGSP